MAEEEAAPGEDPVVVLARKRFQQAIEAEDKNRDKQRDDMRFLAATPDDAAFQWPTNVIDQRRVAGTTNQYSRPTLVVNKMRAHQNQVLNEQKMNRQQMNVRPADSQASKEVAKVLKGWLRHIQVAGEADLAFDIASQWQTGAGEGFVRMHNGYADAMSMEQDVLFEPLPDRFKVYVDPIGLKKHPAGKKCRWGFIVEDLPKEEYEDLYKDDPVDWNLTGTADQQAWFEQQHTVRVAEYFEIRETDAMICLWADGGVTVNGSPGEKRYAGQRPVKERKTKLARCIWRRMNGQKVLGKEREMPTSFIPIIRVVGNEFVVDGESYIDGMVRPAKDAQRMYNYNASKEIEVNALAPLAPIRALVEQMKGHEAIYEKANTAPVPYLPHNAIYDDQGNIVNVAPPERLQPPMPPAAMIQAKIGADQDIKATMGQWGPALGEPSNEKSGKAIANRQRESDVGNFHYMDNLRRAMKYAATIALEMAAEIIDSKRVLRILGEDGEAEHVIVDPDLPVPYQETRGPDGKKVCVYNFNIGRYEVEVDTGPSFTTRRAEAAEFLTNAAQSAKDPASAAVLNYIAMKSQDWDGADEAVTLLKAMLPAPAQEALQTQDEGQQVPPELQGMVNNLKAAVGQAHGQLDAAKQAIAERDQKLQQLDGQLKGRGQDALAKVYESDMRALAEITKARADLLIAQVDAAKVGAATGSMDVSGVVAAVSQAIGEIDAKIQGLTEHAAAIKSQLDNFEIAGRMPAAQETA